MAAEAEKGVIGGAARSMSLKRLAGIAPHGFIDFPIDHDAFTSEEIVEERFASARRGYRLVQMPLEEAHYAVLPCRRGT
jgi:hypothetical protein